MGQDLGDLIQKRVKSCIKTTHLSKEISNIPLEHTPKPPTNMKEFLSFWEFGDAWGMLQGYVGVRTSPSITTRQLSSGLVVHTAIGCLGKTGGFADRLRKR